MMNAENRRKAGCPQRDSAEHEGYVGAQNVGSQEGKEQDGADLLERILARDNLNKAYKRVKSNKGAPGIDGMSVEEALPWLREHREELLERIRKGKYKPQFSDNSFGYRPGKSGQQAIANMKNTMQEWDGWLRRRFRMYIWKQWKLPRTRVKNLIKLGMEPWKAYRNGNSGKGYWAVAGSGILTKTITNERLARAGYYSLSDRYESLHLCD